MCLLLNSICTLNSRVPLTQLICSFLLNSCQAKKGRSVLQGVAVCCSVLQCFAVCCSVLQCVAVCCSVLQCVAVCCSVLQCVAVCCSVLQYVAVCCSVLQSHRTLYIWEKTAHIWENDFCPLKFEEMILFLKTHFSQIWTSMFVLPTRRWNMTRVAEFLKTTTLWELCVENIVASWFWETYLILKNLHDPNAPLPLAGKNSTKKK